MAVNTVVAGVEFTSEIPRDFCLVVVILLDGVPFFTPGNSLLGLFGPETLRITNGTVVNRAVFVDRFNVGVGGEICGRVVRSVVVCKCIRCFIRFLISHSLSS